jgi:putative oxidoreductase
MKIAGTVARLLLGLMFLVFGSNMFLHFIPMGPMPPGLAGEFSGVLMKAHYMVPVGVVMVFSAVLFLANRYVALALVLLGPALVNILLFHLLMAPGSVGMGAFATLLWFILFWREREAFAPLFVPCPRK